MMTFEMRDLSSDEINEVSGGVGLLLAALAACGGALTRAGGGKGESINSFGGEAGAPGGGQGGEGTDTDVDSDSDTDTDTDTDAPAGGN